MTPNYAGRTLPIRPFRAPRSGPKTAGRPDVQELEAARSTAAPVVAGARGTVLFAFGSTPQNPMSQSILSHLSTKCGRTALRFAAPLLGLSLFLAGCGGGGGTNVVEGTTGGTTGEVVAHPDASTPSKLFIVETNSGGEANSMRLLRTMWGRLVDIRDIDKSVLDGLGGVYASLPPSDQETVLASGELIHADFPVSERIVTDDRDYVLRTNAVTGDTTLTILHDSDDEDDREEYESALGRADDLIPIQLKSLSPSEIPPFSVTPRNSSIVLQFDDLLDASSITDQTVRLLTGNPPAAPFQNVRVLPDLNHGDVDGTGAFRTTRVIIDTTISDVEAQEAAANGELLQTSALGLPASVTTGQANIALRIPTRRFLPSDVLLQNLSGKTLSFTADAIGDADSPSLDIVRAFRSGGPTTVTGDLNNGYLLDIDPPQIIGAQGVQVVLTSATAETFTVNLTFDVAACALRPRIGDVLQQGVTFAEIVETAEPPLGDTVTDVVLRVVSPATGTITTGAGLFQATYDPVLSQGKEGCFVRFQPAPSLDPGPNGEVRGVLTGATASVRFSEPIAPESVTPYDSFTVTRIEELPTAQDFVVGRINRTGDLRQFSFVPALPLAKGDVGVTEDYFVTLASGLEGPTDLAGNVLVDALPQISFELLAGQGPQDNSGLVLRFDSQDEIPDADNSPEIRGQLLYDFQNELIRPRPVTRFSAVADRTQAVPSLMTPTPLPIQTPLSGLGSRMQTIWRYIDVGYGLLDETTHNVDVEGLAWSPQSGAVFQEIYPQFEISLAHSRWLPDEDINPTSLFPQYPASGLVPTYANNLLSSFEDPLRVVHERSRGYLVEATTFPASTGTAMVRFPWNVGLTPSERTYYTWRDTSILRRGGPSGFGADPDIFFVANGLQPPAMIEDKTYGINEIPTIGLPLLMDFKCFPSKELGLNGFDTSFAVNSSPRPNFRAFSTGGINSAGVPVIKNPDLETVATGGFNPSAGGSGTLTTDNTFYIGQMDLVTRVSRVYTIWFDTDSDAPSYVLPTVEPRPENQPEGTQIVLAYRGATQVNASVLKTSACYLDAYGNPVDCADPVMAQPPAAPVFFNADTTWKEEIADIQGAQFIQIRMTFISNAETLLTPVLSSFGLAYSR